LPPLTSLRRETPWPASGAFSSNLDVRNGPVQQTWFKGGRTNVCYNALDRHVAAGRGDTVALLWEGNDEARPSHASFFAPSLTPG
jgi:acetyl-CoA synthetase